MRIICVHLYNDYSGSPRVLAKNIDDFIAEGHQVSIITSKNTKGFLSDIKNTTANGFYYRFFESKVLRTMFFFWAQLVIFCKILAQGRQKDTEIYINTLLPFGAALAGRLIGAKVSYHIHETSVKPAFLKKFLRWVANKTAQRAIFVSQYLLEAERLDNVTQNILRYNTLSPSFIENARANTSSTTQKDTILMLCSLKEYKGVSVFVELAWKCPEKPFELVLNASKDAIDHHFKGEELPQNLKIYPAQANVHPFYTRAKVLLNLSHPEAWIETFGMTILEALFYGIPCIVPPIGGPMELVDDNINGFCIDQRDEPIVIEALELLFADPLLYDTFSHQAQIKAQQFLEYKPVAMG